MKHLIVLLSFLLFVGCEKKSPEHKDAILNIAVSSDYPPYIYSKDGKLSGFEIEVITRVAESLKKTIHFHDIAFQGILTTVAKKQVDAAISCIGRTQEREKEVDFSIPYHRSMTVIVVPFASSIQTIEDLQDNIIGVESGTTYENDLKNKINKPTLLFRTKIFELLDALHEGKCKAIVTGYSEAYELQNSNPDLKIIPIEGTNITFSIALPKGSALLGGINAKLEDMLKTGELMELEMRFIKKAVAE